MIIFQQGFAKNKRSGCFFCRWQAFTACRKGVASVELGIVILPLLMLLLGVFQFIMYQYTQIGLNNALYETASSPEPEITSVLPNKAGYKDKLCAKIISTGTYCKDNILIEMRELSAYSTTKTPIQGMIFVGAIPGSPMLLRAAMPVVQFVPFIPKLMVTSSVVFVR